MLDEDLLVEIDGVLIFALNVQDIRHVDLPRVVVTAQFGRPLEQLLDQTVVLRVPVDLRLLHQHGHAPTHGTRSQQCKHFDH